MRIFNPIFLLCFFAYQASAQQKLTKEEIKQLKAEIATLSKNPAKYKQIRKENETLNQNIPKIKKLIDEKTTSQAYLMQDNDQKMLKLHDLETQTSFYTNNKEKNGKNYASSKGQVSRTENIIYRVQIGNYTNPEIQNFLEKNPESNNFVVENAGIGKRYILGEFVTQEEARNFSNLLIKRGGQSFVIAYRNGKRLNNLKELKKINVEQE